MDPSSDHPRTAPAAVAATTPVTAAAASRSDSSEVNPQTATAAIDAAAPGLDADAAGAEADATAPMTTLHLARFEFSEQGTKILMVEWHPGAVVAGGGSDPDPGPGPGAGPEGGHSTESGSASAAPPSDSAAAAPDADKGDGDDDDDDAAAWEISWPGKSIVLPASESDRDQDGTRRRRAYFLLPTDAPVPAAVTLTRTLNSTAPSPAVAPSPGDDGGRSQKREALVLQPLPAIFPEGFDFEAGPRGVLHTIWAKKRLSELDREIDAEMRSNAEGVGLQMVHAERQWIVDNFLPPLPAAQPSASSSSSSASPLTPRSPSSGRLTDKLRGLRLATSSKDLAPSPTANTFTHAGAQSLTLSPAGGDVVVSSFPVRPLAVIASSVGTSNSSSAGPMSLNAALHGDIPKSSTAAPTTDGVPDSQDTEDDLFALPISPRSPDMKKSPFSFL